MGGSRPIQKNLIFPGVALTHKTAPGVPGVITMFGGKVAWDFIHGGCGVVGDGDGWLWEVMMI